MVESFLLRFLIKIVGVMTLFSVETILGLMSGTISAPMRLLVRSEAASSPHFFRLETEEGVKAGGGKRV